MHIVDQDSGNVAADSHGIAVEIDRKYVRHRNMWLWSSHDVLGAVELGKIEVNRAVSCYIARYVAIRFCFSISKRSILYRKENINRRCPKLPIIVSAALRMRAPRKGQIFM
jgi:hypothetical protein